MRKNYHKLIRDRIPEIIAAKGETAKVRTLTDEEFAKALAAKLVEEAAEAQAVAVACCYAIEHDSEGSGELVKEIGDVLEVIDTMIRHFGLDRGEIERVKAKRKAERGGFEKKIFLESVV